MRRLAYILALLLTMGCCPKILPPVVDQVRDTLVVYRDRVVVDTARIEVPLIIEKTITRDTVSHLENDWSVSDASVQDGFLLHSLQTKPQVITKPVYIQVHDTTVVVKQSETETVIEEVPAQLTWWQETKMKLFWVLLVLVGLYGIYITQIKKRSW